MFLYITKEMQVTMDTELRESLLCYMSGEIQLESPTPALLELLRVNEKPSANS